MGVLKNTWHTLDDTNESMKKAYENVDIEGTWSNEWSSMQCTGQIWATHSEDFSSSQRQRNMDHNIGWNVMSSHLYAGQWIKDLLQNEGGSPHWPMAKRGRHNDSPTDHFLLLSVNTLNKCSFSVFFF